jgi:polysaccharide chain length determinant protein (PEP-CTERM system associated)
MKNFENLTFGDYLSILRRRKWYAVVTAFIVSVGAFVYALQIKPTFISETTIFVAGRLIPENYVDSIVRETNPERIEFVRQQVQSRTFIERIVREFQLAGAGADMESVINAVRAKTVLTPLTATAFRLSFAASDPSLAQAVTKRLADRVIQLNDNFRKEKVFGTDQFMDEQYRQANSALADSEEKLRKFYADHFPGVPRDGVNLDSLSTLQMQLTTAEANYQSLLDRRNALERRIQEQKQMRAVGRAQAPPAAPEPAAVEHDAAPAAAPSAMELKLSAKRVELKEKSARYTPLHPEIIALTQEVKELEAQANEERRLLARTAPSPNRATPTRPAESALPQIDTSAFLQAELQLELQRVNKEYAAAEQLKRQLTSRMSVYQSRMNPPAELAQQLSTLNREWENAKHQYTDISSKRSKAGLASEADTSGDNQVFRILDEPNLPVHSSGPARRMVLAGGCFVGLLLGLGAAFGREMLDTSFNDHEQAAQELKLPVLTSIPEIPQKTKGTFWRKSRRKQGVIPLRMKNSDGTNREFQLRDCDPLIREVLDNNMTVAGEQFRLLRAKLSAMQKGVGLKSVIVTSATPNEGKTFSAICLAGIVSQELSKRVLLIDADLRSANAGASLSVGRGSFGLTDLLRERTAISTDLFESSLFRCSGSNWYFLPAGPAVNNPAELLSTPAFESLMLLAHDHFDWVIIDSPPILAVSDTSLLTSICGGTLFVMHTGRTPASLVKEAINRIGPERICGLVMNRVRHFRTNKYYSYYQKQPTVSS